MAFIYAVRLKFQPVHQNIFSDNEVLHIQYYLLIFGISFHVLCDIFQRKKAYKKLFLCVEYQISLLHNSIYEIYIFFHLELTLY